MSGEIQINANRPVINAGQPQQSAQRSAPNGPNNVSGDSSIGPADRAPQQRRRNRAPREFSCLACIGIIFRAIFRCLFGWCLPERQPRRRQHADRDPPAQQPNVPVDERVQQPVQNQNAVRNNELIVELPVENRVQNNGPVQVQNLAPQDLTPDQMRVRAFLEQFPELKENELADDEEERCELFVREFEAQIPAEAKNFVITKLKNEIAQIKKDQSRTADEQKGSARKREPLTDREALDFLMQNEREGIPKVRIYLNQYNGIYEEHEE